ncbi:hypothetical protein G4Z16_11625 [Streptomyces bathyalis]|uniref:Secreted protein n=1 Tax=Streptomyces bathyalis TaxID=2710756 RepID=A0A7T1WRY0_9ACTN|nr:hypothetical protein [Streptomyces bathyalis]QPP06926.1 hypothetical protein G4Z16_11625 [Streptomyces bathyalis]
MSSSVRRGFVVAAAAAGLLAGAAGSASANEAPAGAAVVGGTDAVTEITHGAQHTLEKTGRIAQHEEETGDAARRSSGKAIRDVTQKAGAAVSEKPAAPSNKDLGTVSRIPAQAAPSSAPGLPEDLVIEVPELIPGVPSIGIIPASIPALPVTPTIPAL